jgi:hypothetical protein
MKVAHSLRMGGCTHPKEAPTKQRGVLISQNPSGLVWGQDRSMPATRVGIAVSVPGTDNVANNKESLNWRIVRTTPQKETHGSRHR